MGEAGITSYDTPAHRQASAHEFEPSGEAPPRPAGVRFRRARSSPAPQPSLVMVAGLPPGCGVIELKSRMGAYGPIARTRIDDATATGYVTLRSAAAAMDAIAASLDPGCGITIGSMKVLVLQASRTPNNSKVAIRADQAEATPHDSTEENYRHAHAPSILSSTSAPEAIQKSREIVAYDDLF